MIPLLAGCASGTATETNLPVTNTPIQERDSATPPSTAIVLTIPLKPQSTPTVQRIPSQTNQGPDEFPQGYNPLTGRRVEDASLLDRPALLVSVSHFPPTVRPQGGPSFAR